MGKLRGIYCWIRLLFQGVKNTFLYYSKMKLPEQQLPHDFQDGLIKLDSKDGMILGYTSNTFTTNSQILKKGDTIYIQCIAVIEPQRGKGNFKKFIHKLSTLGLTIKVMNPWTKMYEILKKWDFTETSEQSLTSTEPELEVVMVKLPTKGS